MNPLRRSTRSIKKVYPSDEFTPSYPDGPPNNEFERRVARLNLQSFHSDSFAAIDDIIIYSLFGSKARPNGYRAVIPIRAFGQEQPAISRDQGRAIRKIYGNFVPEQGQGNQDSLHSAAEAILGELPTIFNPDHIPIIEHLLNRYDILYSKDSPVVLEKVSFDNHTISFGLKARVAIPAASPILSTSASLSRDKIPSTIQGVSIINSSRDHKGPKGPRLMLGPLRFANHDCNPNCQFRSIKRSHAYLLWSITEISEGEPVTVRYTDDGSYFPDRCKCKTCCPDNPPEAPRHLDQREQPKSSTGKKRTRRGGRRARNKRRRVASEP